MNNTMNNNSKKVIRVGLSMIFLMTTLLILTACGESTPIEGLVISNEPYVSAAEIGKAEQPTELKLGDSVYASVSLIESPKGMKYQAKWLLDDKEIKSDEKAMATDKRGELVFPLEPEKITAGTLKLQILYKGEVLAEKEIMVK